MEVKVECYAGHRGEETPRRIRFDSRVVEVVELFDSWHGPDYRYFKLLGDDNATYLLRHDERAGQWFLIQYLRGGDDAGPGGANG